MTVMVDAVRKAARGLKRDFGEIENLQVSRKGPGDFVTAADRKAEATLREALMKARPGYGLIMEESGVIEGQDKTHTWHVDPSTAPPTSCTACRISASRSASSARARWWPR